MRRLFSVCAMLLSCAIAVSGCASGIAESSANTPQSTAFTNQPSENTLHLNEQGYSEGFIIESIDDATCKIVGYEGSDEVLYIPASYEGKDIVALGASHKDGVSIGTFENNKTLRQLSIPATLTSIEERAFAGCSNLVAMVIPATVISIGENAFLNCTGLTSISYEADINLASNFNYNWNPDMIPVKWNDPQGIPDSITGLATELFFTGLKSFIGAAAGKVGEIAANNLLSVFGYKSPEEQFRENTSQQLDEIQKSIQEKFDVLSEQVSHLSAQTSDIRNQLDVIEKNILASSDRAELGSRMTIINQYIAKIDTLYSSYEDIAKESNLDVAKISTEKLIAQIEKADLPVMINFINQELSHSSAGTQTPLITLYNQYLTKVYPFAHQTIPKVYLFANYMQGELTKAVQLYTEYCNYQQVVNLGSSAQVKVWQKQSQKAIDTCAQAFKEQENLLPQAADAQLTVECPTFRWTKPTGGYYLVNAETKFRLGFSTSPKPHDQIVHDEDDDNGPRYYFCDENDITHGVTEETFQKLDALRKKYDPYLTNLEFLNKNAGTNITVSMWGCESIDLPYGFRGGKWSSCPTIDINSLGPRKFDNSWQDGIYTWQ